MTFVLTCTSNLNCNINVYTPGGGQRMKYSTVFTPGVHCIPQEGGRGISTVQFVLPECTVFPSRGADDEVQYNLYSWSVLYISRGGQRMK